jgi:putative ATPase
VNDLFAKKEPQAPLADRLRPRTLEEFVGQAHLLGPGKPLRLAFEAGKPHSMILWGPPGIGKTTLARLMARAFDAEFIAISAVLSGVKDIRDAVTRAELALQQSGRRTILFVDEVHRFNKAQQDAFLPHVERGLLTFIGATTENPSFEVISALLSRAAVYVLQPLSTEELGQLFERARSAVLSGLQFSAEARDVLLASADGDARRLYNMLEQIDIAAAEAGRGEIDEPFVRETLAQRLRRFDKGGDQFYDQISALHKAVRGSAPDAALYWLTRMLDGGADPLYIGRRIVRMAVEDIGLADPRALRVALDACETYERLGSPEGELALAEAALYMAIAPKSNAAYVAFGAARELVRNDASRPVPEHLRNAPTRLMKELGHGRDYRYAHDEQDAYAAGENYFPEGMKQPEFYRPTERGLEARIREHLEQLRKLDAEAKRKKR